MARAKANPDPWLENFERRDMPGETFVIEAWRDGSYRVLRGDKVLFNRAAQVGAFFGAPRWPTNRLQIEALESAKVRILGALPDILK